MKLFLKIGTTLSLLILLTLTACDPHNEKAKRVILIGIDGMGVSGFQQAKTPNLDKLVRNGALSLKTRGVMPTVSAPNWGSHLLGAGPEQHGITYNGWTSENHTVEPVEADEKGYFPSVYTLLHQQRPEVLSGFFYDWDALLDLFNADYIDSIAYSKTFLESFDKATPWIINNDPGFTFIYIGHPDEVGHTHQWGSVEYIRALEDVDAAIGSFFAELEKANMFNDTHFIVVTDHGGVGYGHGGLSMEEIEIPWIISGPGVIQNRLIEQPSNVFNTASTIAWLLDLQQPGSWIGEPVLGAFQKETSSSSNTKIYVPQPIATQPGGLYPASEAIVFTVGEPDVKIRYTINGKDPDAKSSVYKEPVLLQKSTMLKAAGFLDGQSSRITSVDYVKVILIDQAKLVNKPAEKYAGEGVETLMDLKTGSSDFKDGNWLGFQGEDLEMEIVFEDVTEVQKVSIGILNLPGSWIFPPESVEVIASVDGDRKVKLGTLNQQQIEKQIKTGRIDLSIPINPGKMKYLLVQVKNIGTCPVGHAGEGQPAWLFVDEVILE